GEINAEEKVTLRFQSSGRLSWVGVKVGDYVKKYQGIASLDQREVQKNLKKYLNTFVNERLDFDQEVDDTQIRNIGGLTEDARRAALRVLAQAQYDLNNAIIDVELKNLAIEFSYISTPIEGIVVRMGSPYAGVNATPTQAEVEIVNPNTVYFSAVADQTEVSELKKGQRTEIILDAYPDDKLRGAISDISFVPKEDETGTVYEVKVTFTENNSNYRYRLGMTGDVNFAIGKGKSVITIPASFVKVENNKKYVLVGEKKLKTYIKTGKTTDSSIEVISGLKQGDVIYD
ncbi:efflux RND transporter periplasmic adaptor subunit, partial [Candidatus Roizmanbacteria bacterium]|nr:efflux RND transporter periplasmic adaptor subunit [Candidatus Roizmanbacteria bacterium]